VPVLLFGASLHAIFDQALAAHSGIVSTAPAVPAGNAALHVTYLFGLLPATASNNILPDWSLSLEAQFYVAFPFLMLFIRRFGALAFAAGTLLTFFVSAHVIGVAWEPSTGHPLIVFPQPSVLPLKLGFFAIGMLLALGLVGRRAGSIGMLLFSAGVLAAYQQSLVVVGAMGLVAVAMFDDLSPRLSEPVRALLGSRAGRFLGRVSYGVYLLHTIVIAGALSLLSGAGWYEGLNGYVRFVVLGSPVLAVSLLAGVLAHRFIEGPGIAIGRRLTGHKRVGAPSTVAPIGHG
jgi:peptidoglycan/LPS O-acetylase OafA/YrhL